MPSYREWLEERLVELQESIAECENLGFHHSLVGSMEYQHIDGLIGLEVKVRAQIAKIPQQLRSRSES